VQTIPSWQSGAVTLLVDTKVPDHVLARARVTVKTAVFQNLEQPDKHLRSYGDILSSNNNFPIRIRFYIRFIADLKNIYMFLLYFAVDNYDWLLTGTAQARVEKLLEEEHSFDEYTEVHTTGKLKPHDQWSPN